MPIDLQRLTQDAQQYTQSEDFQKILPYLLSGGGGALVGSLMSGKRRKDREGRLGYLGRILRNAAVTGGLAAGGHYLLDKGIEKTVKNTVGEDGALAQESNDPGDPLSNTVKNIAFSPLTAMGAGGGALLATDGRPLIGAGRQQAAQALDDLATRTGKSKKFLRSRTAEEVADLGLDKFDDALRRKAGLGSGTGPLGAVSTAARKNPLLSTFGQTHGRRAGRGALGLAAAGLPALLGAILTKEQAA